MHHLRREDSCNVAARYRQCSVCGATSASGLSCASLADTKHPHRRSVSRLADSTILSRALIAPVLQDAFRKRSSSITVLERAERSGTNAVVTAKDGHTLLMVASSHTVAPATSSNLPYDTERDLVPVTMVAANPLLFVTSDTVAGKEPRGFRRAREVETWRPELRVRGDGKPGAACHGTVCPNRRHHDAAHPLSWRRPAVTSLLTGDTQFAVLSPQVSLPQMETGKMRALASGSLTRDPQFSKYSDRRGTRAFLISRRCNGLAYWRRKACRREQSKS